jgi:amino acid transporter
MVRALLYSIGIITSLYVLINAVFVASLGLPAMSSSQALAADLMDKTLGKNGAWLISLLVIVAALSTMNATIITGARTNYALGRNFPCLRFLGRWGSRGDTPVNALMLQGAIALLLVALGTGSRSGFAMMVEYTAPVFWFFLLLVGLSFFVLRRRDGTDARPFRVPLYPFTPLLFCGVCAYMLQSSLVHTGTGALIGVGVLLAGIPLLLLAKPGRNDPHKEN